MRSNGIVQHKASRLVSFRGAQHASPAFNALLDAPYPAGTDSASLPLHKAHVRWILSVMLRSRVIVPIE